jgi:hypothetical protein
VLQKPSSGTTPRPLLAGAQGRASRSDAGVESRLSAQSEAADDSRLTLLVERKQGAGVRGRTGRAVAGYYATRFPAEPPSPYVSKLGVEIHDLPVSIRYRGFAW